MSDKYVFIQLAHDFDTLDQLVKILSHQTYELSQYTKNNDEQNAILLYSRVKQSLKSIHDHIKNIDRWASEITQYGSKLG